MSNIRILTGKIVYWNDPEILAANEQSVLVQSKIKVVYPSVRSFRRSISIHVGGCNLPAKFDAGMNARDIIMSNTSTVLPSSKEVIDYIMKTVFSIG